MNIIKHILKKHDFHRDDIYLLSKPQVILGTPIFFCKLLVHNRSQILSYFASLLLI